MFNFTAQGRIGRLEEVGSTTKAVRLSVAADRLVEGPDGAFSKTEWLTLVSFDSAQNKKLMTELDVGSNIKIEGRIEPKKREFKGVTIYDHSFVITRVDLMSKPKARVKREETAEPAAA